MNQSSKLPADADAAAVAPASEAGPAPADAAPAAEIDAVQAVLADLDAFLAQQQTDDANASLEAAIGSMTVVEQDNVSAVQLVALDA
jgi:hypothetical protein